MANRNSLAWWKGAYVSFRNAIEKTEDECIRELFMQDVRFAARRIEQIERKVLRNSFCGGTPNE